MTVPAWLGARQEELPNGEAWLTEAEREVVSRFPVPKRRADWLLGRWVAKRALVLAGEAAGEGDVEVLAAPSGAPGVSVLGRPSALVLSLSHAHGRAVAGLAASRTRLGFDLERVEERPAAFLGDWFTDAEQRLVATSAEPPLAATLVWSGKEAVMKALREGLRIPPKAVEVSPEEGPADGAWRALAARGPGGERWRGWWRAEAGFVLCVVADPPSGPPRRIG